MKLVKYFLQKRAVTILLLVLVLAGGLFSYFKMGKLEDALSGGFSRRGAVASN